MQKTMICLTEPQMAYLRAEAKRLGITLSDLVRRIVDQYRQADPAQKGKPKPC